MEHSTNYRSEILILKRVVTGNIKILWNCKMYHLRHLCWTRTHEEVYKISNTKYEDGTPSAVVLSLKS